MPRLVGQLAGLERRATSGGRDRIDHAPGEHDDLANSAAGALVLAVAAPLRTFSASAVPIVVPIGAPNPMLGEADRFAAIGGSTPRMDFNPRGW